LSLLSLLLLLTTIAFISMSPPPLPPRLDPIYLAIGLVVVSLLTLALFQEEEERRRRAVLPAEVARATLSTIRRRGEVDDGPPRKRAFVPWNHARAKAAVQEDYLGPTPIFNDRSFERVFRISRRRV
jgi:hypothetical protein